MTTSAASSKIAGCLYGAAIGDALGCAFELIGSDAIAMLIGRRVVRSYLPAVPTSLLFPRKPGRPTDDTAMTIAVSAVVASGDVTAQAFARRFLSDFEPGAGPLSEMFWKGGPGGATVRAFLRLREGADPGTCGRRSDGGNGAAMRAHPVGFLLDRDEALRVAALQARVTHGHPSAVAAAQAVAALVHDALHDVAPSVAVPPGIGDAQFVSAWNRAHADPIVDGVLPAALCDVPMSAWETVAAAHAISLGYSNPIEAIGRAAASGGDTDTIASIVGAIVGARAGIDALPADLIAGLDDHGLVGDAVALAQASFGDARVCSR